MYKIIGGDGKEYGPVSAEQLRAWVREGRANGQTQVQVEGTTGWQALETVAEFANLFHAAESLPVIPPAPVEVTVESNTLDLGSSIQRGWRMMKENAGLLIAGTLVVMLLNGLTGAPFQVGRVLIQLGKGMPVLLVIGIGLMVVGQLLSLAFSGPILGGMYWPFIKLARGQSVEFGDFFAGFRRGFLNLLLANVCVGLLSCLWILPGGGLLAAGLVMIFRDHRQAALPLMVTGGCLLAVGLPFAIYYMVSWVFTLPLVVERQIGFWEAMKVSKAAVRKQWWTVFGYLMVVGLIAVSGILACCVGLIFTIPLGTAIQMVIYKDIFGGSSQTA
jgi:hypothetical protein